MAIEKWESRKWICCWQNNGKLCSAPWQNRARKAAVRAERERGRQTKSDVYVSEQSEPSEQQEGGSLWWGAAAKRGWGWSE